MSQTTASRSATAAIADDPWGARARDWAEIEDENSRPLFEEVLDAAGVTAGATVLDVGCGSSLACAIGAARGARVSGLDSSPGLLEVARERVPDGDFRVGDMVSLPWADDSFDVVTFVNTFFFASDRESTMREAARVARAGGRVAVVVWPEPESVDLTAYLAALGPLMPPLPMQVDPFIGRKELDQLARRAGLEPQRTLDLDWSWEYRDDETMLRGLLSPGLSTLAIEAAGEDAVRDALTAGLEQFRLAGGGYRLENAVRCLIATA